MANNRFGTRTRPASFSHIIETNTQCIFDTLGLTASQAYAFRRLTRSYNGNAIRVRRSSDNTEQDIAFSDTNGIDTTSLLSFVGANNGFLTKWYDQSGNGRDLSQVTAALQPKIVNAGSLLTMGTNNKLYADFNSQKMTFTGYNIGAWTTFNVYNSVTYPSNFGGYYRNGSTSNLGFCILGGQGGATRQVLTFQTSNTAEYQIATTSVKEDYNNYTNYVIETTTCSGSARGIIYDNGLNITQTASSTGWGTINVGEYGSFQYTGTVSGELQMQEFIVFNSVLSTSNRQLLAQNMNTYYGVY